ncbi:signal transduction histidine kinase [Natranaerovirga hydrolytica]|uniref:Circadian input-output histidine kinase CikA n=1 Tax=Natranaerovirga hydrolytica TaxID=680378 RepID=A0A4R1MDA3_9FIRM|nr:substrate-binding domain-containing protein [Natranaerovirga hydrolytica]TCK88009.1 signal transduction histidine kinase [Natranaerovirga hydrolytica]
MYTEERMNIGYVTPFIWGDISLTYLKGAMQVTEEHNANLICIIGQKPKDPHNNNSSANIIYDFIDKKNVNGLIAWASHYNQYLTSEETLAFFKKFSEIPIITISNRINNIPALITDNENGIHSLVSHLYNVHGYKKIAFVRGPSYHNVAQKRYHAFLNAMKTYNLEVNADLITTPLPFSEASGHTAVTLFVDERNLSFQKDIEAIICPSDFIALGVSNALKKRHVKIPNDVALVGFNNKRESIMCNPPITTIDPRNTTYGKIAARLLMNNLVHGTEIKTVNYIPTKLIVRRSCGCLEPMANTQDDSLFFSNEKYTEDIEAIKLSLRTFHSLTLKSLEHLWVDKMIDYFNTSLHNPDSDHFINYLQHLLDELKEYEEDIGVIQNFISEMRKFFLPTLKKNTLIIRASNLWNQARVQINLATEYTHANYQKKTDQFLVSLHSTTQTLTTTYSLTDLLEGISKILVDLQIPGCYISLYTNSQKPLNECQLIFGFNHNKRLVLEDNLYYNPKELLPKKYIPSYRYTMILHPLYFKDYQLGFVLFEVGPLEKANYHILCNEISSALYRIKMFEQLKTSEKQRTDLLRELEEKNQELELKIKKRTAAIQKVNEQLKNAIHEARSANLAKSRFLANMSHEIRTPLNCIIGFVEILNVTKSKTEQKEYINLIIEESERLMELINQILDFSKIESGKLSLNNEPFNLNTLLESLTSTYSTIASNKGLDYTLTIHSDIGEHLIGDSIRLRQVLVNLINNAIKFTYKGSVHLLVTKENESHDHITLLFEIKDTGIGIKENRQKEIFNLFEQAENSTTRKYGGTGLGTAISKQLVELMNGQIGVISQENTGSTFWFTAKFQKLDFDFNQTSYNLEKEYASMSLPDFDGNYKILLAEDYSTNQRLVSSHLNSIGIKVDIAENGIIAVNKAKANAYDLILMDIQMPEMDGIEATQILRNLPKHKQTSIIGLTANAFESDIKKYLSIGMNDIITKPFRKIPFLSKIIQHLTNQEVLQKEHTIHEAAITLQNEYLTNTPIDIHQLTEDLNGDTDFTYSLTKDFTNITKEQLKELETALKHKDYQKVETIAHTIKGAALNICAHRFANLAMDLEDATKNKSNYSSKLILNDLVEELMTLEKYLQNLSNENDGGLV